MNYTLDIINVIGLDKNISYLKQSNTSNIFVQYTDGTTFFYDNSFKKIKQITIFKSSLMPRSMTVSDSG